MYNTYVKKIKIKTVIICSSGYGEWKTGATWYCYLQNLTFGNKLSKDKDKASYAGKEKFTKQPCFSSRI